MPELDQIVDAAVADAPAPDIMRVRRVVARRRRGRALVTSTVIVACIVAVAGLLLVTRDDPSTVTATGDTATSTPSQVGVEADFSNADLQRELAALGHSVRVVDAQPSASPLLGTSPTQLCVDGARTVQAYEYASDTERMTWSAAISQDGGTITRGNTATQVLWIAPPRFFARGRLIALYIGSNDRLIADLATVLGPTLDPNVPQGADTREQPC